MLEFLGRFVVDVLLQGLLDVVQVVAHALTLTAVPPLTGGRVKAEPLRRRLVLVRRGHGVHRLTDGTPVVGERLAEPIGVILIMVVVAVIVVLAKYA